MPRATTHAMKRATLLLAAALSLAAQAPYQDRFVTVNGLRLHYLDWGSPGKQPFIMLHGIGRLAHSFDHIAPRFNRDYHVIAIDMRGHGDSAWSPRRRLSRRGLCAAIWMLSSPSSNCVT